MQIVESFKHCGATIIKTRQFEDERGWFTETFNKDDFLNLGLPTDFHQENQSFSKAGTFRGLHFQSPQWQGKLVMSIGLVEDFWVDLRVNSPYFKRVGSAMLEPGTLVYIPKGFAHGFFAAEDAYFKYLCTDPYKQEDEHSLSPVGLDERLQKLFEQAPFVSEKDKQGVLFKDIPDDVMVSAEGFFASGPAGVGNEF